MKRFTMRDEKFVCEHCHQTVSPLGFTARDHCPFCLYSKHVDIFPGDRQNSCHGLLKPIGVEKFKDSFKILYRCERCHALHKNKMAEDDNMDLLIELSSQE